MEDNGFSEFSDREAIGRVVQSTSVTPTELFRLAARLDDLLEKEPAPSSEPFRRYAE
jgi:hypothetical protein